ncbi:TAF2 [Bugula neritina]|uniref:Transcription initiation factor TFIID 150 kDa subunit n=1 Tax=Bugula neritina TaxID=10212 RepID=A0A7J7JJL7_BUGNE|nr:TAF2 [Bugula neritina]
MLLDVCNYEQRETPIILDSSTTMSRSYFDINRPQTIPSEYVNVFTKKSCLVLRMLENRLGKELLLQVFNKMLSLAALSSSSEYSTGMWDNVMFSKSVFTVTGKDLEVFINQWVYQSGCAYFTGKCKFNKKRNVVELELKQDSSGKGVLKYVGPLEVTIQELDGSFNHTFKIEENKTKFEITCHSKSRRQKKKKIPLMTGEEVEMDMASLDPDSPMIWLRIDPNMLILRKLNWELTDTMWQYQLKYERDVVAQCEALHALESEKDFATSATRSTLMEIVDDDHCFYKVRIMATHSLVKVANQMMWSGPPPMLHVFQKKFGSNSCSNIVRQLKFKNFQSYYLQRALPVAMANTRTTTTICPTEITHFILDLFRYSDNSRNKYSDCYYVASLVEAATNTISISTSINSLSNESKLILEEVTRLLNLEKVLPSYRNVITISCLKCVRTLQQKGHLPSTSTLFKSYAQFGMFIDVRLAALDIISGFLTEGETQKPQLDYLLDLVEKDPVPRVRHHILLALITQHSAISSLITTQYILSISNQLWKLMNLFCGQDTKLCSEVVELYYKLFGNKNPQSLVPEEPERGRPVADVPYTSYTADDGEYNVDNPAMEATIDYMNSVDNVVPDLGESKSKLKKKKKKNKHKHKHKSEKKERDESSRHALVSASPYLASAHDYPGPSSVQLSDPSSAEDDFLDV